MHSSSSVLSTDPRLNERCAWQCPAKIVTHLFSQVSAETHDLSLSGMSLHARDPIALGASCTVGVLFLLGTDLCRLNVGALCTSCTLQPDNGYRIGMQFEFLNATTRALIENILNWQRGRVA